MIGPVWLFADIDFGIVIFIIFIIIGAIGSLMTKIKEAQEAARRQQRRIQAGGQKEKAALEDEIGTFLRGAGRPAKPPGRPAPAPLARPARRPVSQPRTLRPVQPARPVQPPRRQPAGAVLTEAPARPPGGQQPPQRLGHLARSDIGGVGVEADEKVAEHVHEVFDHRLGRLEGAPGETARPAEIQEPSAPEDQISPLPTTAAAGLAALFAHAESLRQAILFHEILRRPEERWNW